MNSFFDNLDSEDFADYAILLIEEADYIINNRIEYLRDRTMSEDEKIDRIRELMDFFILEDHMIIYDDLWNIMNMILLKKYIECSASDLI
jgi:FMN-dependent NADH-azoreductase